MHLIGDLSGIEVKISISALSSKNANFLKNVSHLNGRVEVDLSDFSGSIVISRHSDHISSCQPEEEDEFNPDYPEVVVDAVPDNSDGAYHEKLTPESISSQVNGALLVNDSYHSEAVEVLIEGTNQRKFSTKGDEFPSIKSTEDTKIPLVKWFDDEKKSDSFDRDFAHHSRYLQHSKLYNYNLSFHQACASESVDVELLRAMLKANPKLASVPDEYGNYPVQIFARNECAMYAADSVEKIRTFVSELYFAFPTPFCCGYGFLDDIPFSEAISEWIGECHQTYVKIEGNYELSDINELSSRSMSRTVREDMKMLASMPSQLSTTPRLVHSIKMLSFLLDKITLSACEDISSSRRETFALVSKRRDHIIKAVASIPFLIRTILLIEDQGQRDELLQSSIINNALFREESVDQWIVSMMCGRSEVKRRAVLYFKLVSQLSLTDLIGLSFEPSFADLERYHQSQTDLFNKIGEQETIIPSMLCLGKYIEDAASTKIVVHLIDHTLGEPFVLGLIFVDLIGQFILMISYRLVIELVYSPRSNDLSSDFREYWGLAYTIVSYLIIRDLSTICATASTGKHLVSGYGKNFWNFINWVAIFSVLAMLLTMNISGQAYAVNYLGITAGMLWLRLLRYIKGVNEHISTLVFTVMQIARKVVPFIIIFFITLFMFADMIEIILLSSGDCEGNNDIVDDDGGRFCYSDPMNSYLLMYSFLVGGVEFSTLHESTVMIRTLLILSTVVGIIILTNILIAIVTDEYGAARQRSFALFGRSRLELAAIHAARAQFLYPPSHISSNKRVAFFRPIVKALLLVVFVCLEVFLFQVITGSFRLVQEGILSLFFVVSLLICTVLMNLCICGWLLYSFSRATRNAEWAIRLRESRMYAPIVDLLCVPVRYYKRAIGIGRSKSFMRNC